MKSVTVAQRDVELHVLTATNDERFAAIDDPVAWLEPHDPPPGDWFRDAGLAVPGLTCVAATLMDVRCRKEGVVTVIASVDGREPIELELCGGHVHRHRRGYRVAVVLAVAA